MTIILIITALFSVSFGFILADIIRNEDTSREWDDTVSRFLILNKNVSIVRDEEGRYALVDLSKQSIESIPKNKWCTFIHTCILTYKKD